MGWFGGKKAPSNGTTSNGRAEAPTAPQSPPQVSREDKAKVDAAGGVRPVGGPNHAARSFGPGRSGLRSVRRAAARRGGRFIVRGKKAAPLVRTASPAPPALETRLWSPQLSPQLSPMQYVLELSQVRLYRYNRLCRDCVSVRGQASGLPLVGVRCKDHFFPRAPHGRAEAS